MKEFLQRYAGYNIWANQQLFNRISQLNEEDITKEIASSFPSLYKTVVHMWLAEDVWWQRLQLVENIVLPAQNFTGTFDELCKNLAKQSRLWKDWVDNASINQLNHVFAYIRNKEQLKIPVNEMLVHLFNHATYHRGQLVTLLQQLKANNIPATDFSIFTRLKK